MDNMTMSRVLSLCLGAVLLAGPALADDSRWRDCRTCHAVEAPSGDVIVRGGRSGPNLYGIANRPLAADSGFRFYSDDLRAAGATGARWTEENFVSYLAAPDQFLRAMTGNPNAESGMHVALRSGGRELFQWLRGLSN
ncbi:MAG: cytochrome C [Rhodobacteraceae bacterium]|nr:MAG: cytochrome C [Paracoccaceae bacterium]